MTKLAKDLHMGDVTLVDSGRGPSPRIVDGVRDKDGKIEVILYTEHGRRPRLLLKPDRPVECQ